MYTSTLYVRCFLQESIKCTVICGVHIRFWLSLCPMSDQCYIYVSCLYVLCPINVSYAYHVFMSYVWSMSHMSLCPMSDQCYIYGSGCLYVLCLINVTYVFMSYVWSMSHLSTDMNYTCEFAILLWKDFGFLMQGIWLFMKKVCMCVRVCVYARTCVMCDLYTSMRVPQHCTQGHPARSAAHSRGERGAARRNCVHPCVFHNIAHTGTSH
jgi:hypothetical protein